MSALSRMSYEEELALKAENARLRAAIDEVARITVDKDRVAEAIYRASPWNDPGVTGHPQREWRIEGVPWDTDSDVQLCEHERDDYRSMARGVIDYLRTACEAIVRDGKASAT